MNNKFVNQRAQAWNHFFVELIRIVPSKRFVKEFDLLAVILGDGRIKHHNAFAGVVSLVRTRLSTMEIGL